MDSCDLLIVGGGPAGSACAWKAVRGGLDTIILDKSPFPRHKVCGGWITPAVLEALQIEPREYGAGPNASGHHRISDQLHRFTRSGNHLRQDDQLRNPPLRI